MKSASLSQKAYSVLMFLAVSVLAGLLLSGLAVPFAALAGGSAKLAAESLEYLPADLETPPQSERSRILMADGQVLATFFNENRIYVPLSEIAPAMQDAQIAIEDHRFYEHGAIDFQGFGRAFVKTMTGDTQGASTLTQQYVKLVRVESAVAAGDKDAARKATEVTIDRKIIEARYAMALEERLTKDEILERYLNIAYYGEGAYGVEAAAQHYWGTTAKDLTLEQAAMLAGLVQNPVALNPVKNPVKAIERRNFVLSRMAELGIISEERATEAKAVAFDPATVRRTPNGCTASPYPFLCDYVRRTLLSDQMPSMGETTEERENLLNRGGLTIQTLINPTAQAAAEAAVADLIAPTDPVLAGAALIQPSTGLIVAMAQSRPDMGTDAGETYYNYNVEESMGGAEGYQAGSTFKTFTIAAALDLGMTPQRQYNAPEALPLEGMTFKNCTGPFVFKQDHTVRNYNRGYGLINMIRGAEDSVNTYFMQLEADAGICASIDMAKAAGVKMSTGQDLRVNQNYPTFVLGTSEVTPLSMAEAYATFANRGIHCTPIILETVTTKDGSSLAVPPADCKQVIRPEIADGVNFILKSVIDNGTGRPARLSDGRPQAGKTGTISENQAVWFAGYTPEMAGAAWIAIDKTNPWYESKRKTLKNVRLPSGTYLRGSGGGDAGLIWKAAMASALADKPKTAFNAPTTEVLEGVKVPLPDVSGMGYNEAKRTLEAAGFQTQRWSVYSNRSAGTFLGISPTGSAVKFSTVSLKVSQGPKPAPRPEPVAPAPAAPAEPAPPAEEAPGNAEPGNPNE
ncbi:MULTISPECIES: transglycosylase domain-containing protein [unclassified Tessaracoccus]|uniref:transglycosylase domain-containing protein n=1 Tax=unclassified Tessaracoccus TaxID=2635419 RepID=UPI002102B138|nr:MULTISPECIES: transglycosylase domain-containing protein [unclassified Tessaracoccus]